MATVSFKEVSTRLGNFCVIRINKMYLVTACDNRMKIVKALSQGEMTAEEIAQNVGAAYSTVMDHMDVLEKLEIVTSQLKRSDGKRRISFRLKEDVG